MEIEHYIVYGPKKDKVLYSGNNAFKASQTLHAKGETVLFKGKIQKAVFNHIIALQQRLN